MLGWAVRGESIFITVAPIIPQLQYLHSVNVAVQRYLHTALIYHIRMQAKYTWLKLYPDLSLRAVWLPS